MSYGIDFKECVVRNIKEGMKWDQAMEVFKVSRNTLGRWMKKERNGENLEDAKRKEYRPQKIDPQRLKELIRERPDATLEELAKEFDCYPSSVRSRLLKLSITRKKNHTVC